MKAPTLGQRDAPQDAAKGPKPTEERQRLTAIAAIVRQRKVKSQTDLRRLLAIAGIHTTQSSISRSLSKLGVIKLGGIYHMPGST